MDRTGSRGHLSKGGVGRSLRGHSPDRGVLSLHCVGPALSTTGAPESPLGGHDTHPLPCTTPRYHPYPETPAPGVDPVGVERLLLDHPTPKPPPRPTPGVDPVGVEGLLLEGQVHVPVQRLHVLVDQAPVDDELLQ